MPLRRWFTAIAQTSSLQTKLQDPFYRLQTFEEVQQAASLGFQIDVNQADTDDWLRLPGISIHQARTLAELRRSGVQFHAVEDLAAALGLAVHRLQPLAPVLRFCYYDPESVCQIQPINVNTATAEMLVRLPGVDLYLARAIVTQRRQGTYRNLPHLQRRLSLPADLTERLMHYLTF